jgi:hypothetical protein
MAHSAPRSIMIKIAAWIILVFAFLNSSRGGSFLTFHWASFQYYFFFITTCPNVGPLLYLVNSVVPLTQLDFRQCV